MEDKIIDIQAKYVLRDYDNPITEYEMLKYTWKEAQREIIDELYNSLTHNTDEDKTLYLPLIKLGEIKERLN